MIDTTNENEVQAPRTRAGRLFVALSRAPRAVRYLAALAFAAFAMIGGTGVSMADTPDPGTSGVQSLFDGAKSVIGGTLIPAVVGIVLLGALFWLGLTWFSKGKNKGNK